MRYLWGSPDFDLNPLHSVFTSETDPWDMWNDKSIEAVIIATPNETHYSLAETALRHGKHVLVEKPLALTSVECAHLRKLSRDTGLTLLTEYTHTFSPLLNMARNELIKPKGTLMTVKHLGRFGGGNVYWLLASHMLSVLDMFCPLSSFQWTCSDIYKYGDTVETGSLYFNNENLSGQIIISLNHPYKETEVVFYGDGWNCVYNPGKPSPLILNRYSRPHWDADIPVIRSYHETDECNNLSHALAYFAKCIKGEAPDNADTAVEITRILEEICPR